MGVGARLVLGFLGGMGFLLIAAGARGVNVLGPMVSHAVSRRARIVSMRDSHRDETPLVEALAVWTEQLRDTMAGASGLEQAMTVTARTAPLVVRPAIERLAARIGFGDLSSSIREFAAEVDHPLADFVAAALITAAENQVREMGTLLGHLADCCRDDVAMRTRVWVARARTRSAVRIISVVVVVFVMGLALLDPGYLTPYSTPAGMVMASIVLCSFVSALSMMRRMGRLSTPTRFIARREVVPA